MRRPFSVAGAPREVPYGDGGGRTWAGVHENRPQFRPSLRARSVGPRRGEDPCPDVVSAGARVGEVAAGGVRQSLQPDVNLDTRPSTPERERWCPRVAPGQGQEDVPLRINGMGYGRPTRKSEGVAAVIQANPSAATFSRERSEAVYESNRREPLGKGYVRGHELPAHVRDAGFGGFGQVLAVSAAHPSAQQGKDVIAPAAVPVEDPETHARYARTHQAFHPGEQLDRGYAWPAAIQADPTYAFGGRPEGARLQDGAGVKSVLASDGCTGADGAPGAAQTRIVPQEAEEWRRGHHGPVGGRAIYGASRAGRPPVPAGFAYGAPSAAGDSAGELIRGYYRPEDLQPDKDLGRCIKEGRRNVPTEHAFGRPSQGRQQPPAAGLAGRSSAGTPSAFQPPPRLAFEPRPRRPLAAESEAGSVTSLLNPHRLAAKGSSIKEFAKPRGRDEVSALMKGAGYHLRDADFERLWGVAVRRSGGDCGCEEQASLEAVIEAYGTSRAEST